MHNMRILFVYYSPVNKLCVSPIELPIPPIKILTLSIKIRYQGDSPDQTLSGYHVFSSKIAEICRNSFVFLFVAITNTVNGSA